MHRNIPSSSIWSFKSPVLQLINKFGITQFNQYAIACFIYYYLTAYMFIIMVLYGNLKHQNK
ncbi:hypothetical protein HanPI659440_Chr04g0165231 [Helianthus annuus]|nr:hypothetical protein HanPI659440_Chr04g0165231 [Helianthus annuus]